MDEIFEQETIINAIRGLLRGNCIIADGRKIFLGKADGKYTLCIEADRIAKVDGDKVSEKIYLAFDIPFGQFLSMILESLLKDEECDIQA